ncbi:MAG: hypothetical protein C0448_04620 [Sphingobacteriaceae bacterium]|nr:hypothetical protein [Sphingobacteriaceae bacterium]
MKLSEFKKQLSTVTDLNFVLPNGTLVPKHFHVTEVGQITKNFIDCGGTVRNEKVVNFQLWEANDFDHRLAPKKLNDIIALSEKVLGLEDGEIEVEYQSDTIGKYGVEFNGKDFTLTSKQTNCLANDSCGIPTEKLKVNLVDLSSNQSCCTPSGKCC